MLQEVISQTGFVKGQDKRIKLSLVAYLQIAKPLIIL